MDNLPSPANNLNSGLNSLNTGLISNEALLHSSALASCARYDTIINKFSDINKDYSILATKAIALNNQYFPQTLQSCLANVSNSFSALMNNTGAAFAVIDKACLTSPIFESTRIANSAINSISIKGLNAGIFNYNNISSPQFITLHDKSNSLLPSISDSGNLLIKSDYNYFQKMDTATSVLMNTNYIKQSDALKFNVESSFARMSKCSLMAESCLSRIPWQNVGSLVNFDENNRIAIKNNFLDTTIQYRSIWEGIQANPAGCSTYLPITRLTPIEHFWNANLLESLSIPEKDKSKKDELETELIEENEIGLYALLPKLNPDLQNMWTGAKQALGTSNPDRVRHFTVSIRELFTHVMHTLAPDDKVEAWSKDPSYYHNGKPTRKARLLYICRKINQSCFVSFVNSDVKATLDFMELFNEGTHAITPSFSEEQILAIKSKSESTLKFILEIGLHSK